jgi:RNA polymerase subunit RPABC4/transcription elongation factor Spt4
MASSGEKIFFVVILAVILYFLISAVMPMFFLRDYLPPDVHFLGAPRFLISFLPMVLIFAAYLIAVVWVYRDAESRGMSGVLWSLLVLVGNFIGLIIYLIVRNDELPGQMAAEIAMSCPNCGKSVAQKFSFCPYCGTRLKAICPACEKTVSGDWIVCPYCGKNLKENE